MAKFGQNPKLKQLLVETGNAELVEASPYDRVWGVGVDVRAAMNKQNWNGQNLLGKALMDVRTQLINQ